MGPRAYLCPGWCRRGRRSRRRPGAPPPWSRRWGDEKARARDGEETGRRRGGFKCVRRRRPLAVAAEGGCHYANWQNRVWLARGVEPNRVLLFRACPVALAIVGRGPMPCGGAGRARSARVTAPPLVRRTGEAWWRRAVRFSTFTVRLLHRWNKLFEQGILPDRRTPAASSARIAHRRCRLPPANRSHCRAVSSSSWVVSRAQDA